MPDEDQGRVAYTAYADLMIGRGIWASHMVVPWSALSVNAQDAWRAAASAVS